MSERPVTAFDSRRWGIGGIASVVVLLVLGASLFVYGLDVRSTGLQVLGSVCLVGGVAVFAVKLGEEIHPATAKWDIVGEVGEVVREVGEGRRGVARVRSEQWTCMSEDRLMPGTKVRVIRVEGLVAWVERLDDTTTLKGGSGFKP
ncbi:MAG: hypothetical protein JRN21_00215 [Nitrososphaerota archaeon]|nr:hypothetical protein [Nitrososphaerota archaeon]